MMKEEKQQKLQWGETGEEEGGGGGGGGGVEVELVQLQQLRSKATELLVREEWKASAEAYSQFISICRDLIISKCNSKNSSQYPDSLSMLKKSLCLAHSNRAKALSHLTHFSDALRDCDSALEIESTHFKTLLRKGKVLLNLNIYSLALDYFKTALLDPQAATTNSKPLIKSYLERCRKLELQARTGAFDLSDWILSGFCSKSPELAEYIGGLQVKKSNISGRGLFAAKSIDAGTLVLCNKAIAVERAILPPAYASGCDRAPQLVMWKNLIKKITEAASKSPRTRSLIRTLSTGEEEKEVPDIRFFKAGAEESSSNFSRAMLENETILSALDMNSLVEDAASAKVLGKKSDLYGIGLWALPALINHSCAPNARRLHVGDHMMVHASRGIKAGEEITFAYFDVLSPLNTRRKMSQGWGFQCKCRRCEFEEDVWSKSEMREIEASLERGLDMGDAVYRLDQVMRTCGVVRGREKGYLRASFWTALSKAYKSDMFAKRWGRRVPPLEVVVDSVVEAVGSDERVIKASMEEESKRSRGNFLGLLEMERAIKLGRGVYGKVMKKQAVKTLLGIHD